MLRVCTHCQKAFTPQELSREVSKDIESTRKASGAEGLMFRLYACAHCGHENLFVDIHHLEGESDEGFRERRRDLEAAIQEARTDEAAVVLVEKPAHDLA